MPNEQVIEGIVDHFASGPGHTDLTVTLRSNEDHFGNVFFVLPNEADSQVTWNGDPVSLVQLITKMVDVDLRGDADYWRQVYVVLHSRTDRYGASTQAEFSVQRGNPKH